MQSGLFESDRSVPFAGLRHLRLVVGGGRDYSNRVFVFRIMTDIHLVRGIAVVIHGGQTGG
jgi:hypothetical protein